MQIKKVLLILSVVVVAGSVSFLFSRDLRVIKKEKEFYRAIKNAPLALVIFFQNKDKDGAWQRNLRLQMEKFDQLAHSPYYKQVNFKFIKVDLANPQLHELRYQYAISGLPTFVLFKYGVPLRNGDGTIVQQVGFTLKKELQNFIMDNVGDAIEDIIEQQAQQREQASAYMNFSVGAYPGGIGYYGGWYYDPYYPYWSPYYGPGVGASVGFTVPLN